MRGSDVTAIKHTPHNRHRAATPQHVRSNSGIGQGFPVCGLPLVVGDVGRSLAQSVEVSPTRSKEGGGHAKGSQRLPRDRVSKSPVDLASRKRVGGVKASGNLHKVQSTWPVQCGRTSEGFWHPVHLACPVWQDSEGFWKTCRPSLSSPSDDSTVKASGKATKPI